jgi:glycosyltransferase involved in cell wall biosynthesis
LEAVSQLPADDDKIICVFVGSLPAFDDTAAVQKKLADNPALAKKVRLLPACAPNLVWEYLCAADIFAFSSHAEGMPNSLLEAMVMRVPAIAFGIPPVEELNGNANALRTVPPFDSRILSHAIAEMAASPESRIAFAERGHARIMDRFLVKKNMNEAIERIAAIIAGKPI